MIKIQAKVGQVGMPIFAEAITLPCHLVILDETSSEITSPGEEARDIKWSEGTPQIIIGLKTPKGVHIERFPLRSYLKVTDVDDEFLAKNPHIVTVEDNGITYLATLLPNGKYDRLIKSEVADCIDDEGKVKSDALSGLKWVAQLAKIATGFSKEDVSLEEANALICEKNESGNYALPEDKKFYCTLVADKSGKHNTVKNIINTSLYNQRVADAKKAADKAVEATSDIEA